jgi:UDP-N-acetylmuramate: L-alanyl-gamma-D-glutamyl-meso-diaminopimelate ligase
MKIHFIAIGGSVMHYLAIELASRGYDVSGSDDEIYDPAYSNLKEAGLLPDSMGWDTGRITELIDIIILGMHAKSNNPELKKAEELGIKIMSYPEFIALESKNKKKIVIAGSHGKTTTTSMIMNVLQHLKIDFDYLVGAKIQGFNRMVKLTSASLIVLEGDEYLSSPIDERPKIHHYSPEIAVLTGIAWDHINVFPTFRNYVHQFQIFLETLPEGATLIYNFKDPEVKKLVDRNKDMQIIFQPYNTIRLNKKKEIISETGRTYQSKLIGHHNFENMAAALKVCSLLGIQEEDFFRTMTTFAGPAKRLQLIKFNEEENSYVYKDFAHAPSKVLATVTAIKEWYPEHTIIAFLELHTFSSLNPRFLKEYNGTLAMADKKIVYYNEHTLQMKKMDLIPFEVLKDAFGHEELVVCTNRERLQNIATGFTQRKVVYLFMTSGNFSNLDLQKII